MSIKEIVKKVLYPIQCLRYRIIHHNGYLYIGKACKIVNSSRMEFGKNTSIMPYTMLVCHGDESRLSIGEGTAIGMFSRVACLHYVEIGTNVLTGPHIFIADYNHEYSDISVPIMFQGNSVKKNKEFPNGGIKIGDGTWIGTNAVIAGTITIGKHCVIGANSVVTHDIPDYSIACGSPCKIIKQYNFKTERWERV